MPILAWIIRGEVQYLALNFNIWLNKTRRVPILKWLIPIRTKEKNIKTNHDRKTAHGVTNCFFCQLKSTFRPFTFHHANFHFFYYIRVDRTKSPHRASTRSCWTHSDGFAISLRFSITTGRERTVPGRAPPHPPLLELRTRT